jgi:hypothetical protein
MRHALLFILLFASRAFAAGETPAPEPKAAAAPEPAKARAPLKLRLDEIDSRPRIPFTPRDADKNEPAATLPGLGGEPSRVWERPASAIVPKDSTPGQ